MNNEQLEKLGGILFLSAIVIFGVFLLLQPSDECLSKKYILNKNLQGIIIEKFYDKKHSNIEVLKVWNKDKFNVNFNSYSERKVLFEYAQIGDSIYKPKDVLEIKLYRENFDTTFVFNYDCDKW